MTFCKTLLQFLPKLLFKNSTYTYYDYLIISFGLLSHFGFPINANQISVISLFNKLQTENQFGV